MHSPLRITVMLACHVSQEPAQLVGASWDSMAGKQEREWLLANGLINEDCRATERGKLWVEYICDTPLPMQKWTLPGRRALESHHG